ncbi:hypothetical protein [Streptomonospora halophila]|uniref:hypothetical protein n=1 Tax=Streptomonospora halophila TaxID=427369 RepID=UPI0031EF9235
MPYYIRTFAAWSFIDDAYERYITAISAWDIWTEHTGTDHRGSYSEPLPPFEAPPEWLISAAKDRAARDAAERKARSAASAGGRQ